MILVIDNYDSFTFNLVQLMGETVDKVSFRARNARNLRRRCFGLRPQHDALSTNCYVAKNDELDISEIKRLSPSHIILSPGPGIPSRAGITCSVIETFAGEIPILGVCLGFQAIAEVYGGKLKKAPKLFHGKTSIVYHKMGDLFEGVSNPFEAMRYHSWIVDPKGCESRLDITAWTDDAIPMALESKHLKLYGAQFHPESILTPEGKKMIKNFLSLS